MMWGSDTPLDRKGLLPPSTRNGRPGVMDVVYPLVYIAWIDIINVSPYMPPFNFTLPQFLYLLLTSIFPLTLLSPFYLLGSLWCCAVCLYVENPPSATQCTVCDSPNYAQNKVSTLI